MKINCFQVVLAIITFCFSLLSSAFAYTVYMPHITGDSPDWTDYLQVDNDSLNDASFEMTLYDSDGKSIYQGCPPGSSTLPPGSTSQVAANIKSPDSGTEFEATITLCTLDDLGGECVERTVRFTFVE